MTDSLDSILSGKGEAAPPPEATPNKEPTTPAVTDNRDEAGRFRSTKPLAETPAADQSAAEPKGQPDVPVATPQGGQPQAPIGAVRAERGRRQEAEAEVSRVNEQMATMAGRLEQFERMFQGAFPKPKQAPPPPPPDPYADPQAFQEYGIRQALTPLQEQMEHRFDAMSRVMAEQAHGADVVKAAYEAMAQAIPNDPAVQDDHKRIMASAHPYVELVSWHKRRQALSEIGSDPAAYRERVKAELMAEMQANGGGQPAPRTQPGRTPAVMPSNLAGARNVGTRTGPDWSGPAPIQDIFDRGKKR